MSYISELNTSHVDYCKCIAEQLSKNPNLFNDIEQRVWDIVKTYDTMPEESFFIHCYVEEVHKELENQIVNRLGGMDISLDIKYDGTENESKFYINDNRILNLKDVEKTINDAMDEAIYEILIEDADYSAVEEIKAELENRKEQNNIKYKQ